MALLICFPLLCVTVLFAVCSSLLELVVVMYYESELVGFFSPMPPWKTRQVKFFQSTERRCGLGTHQKGASNGRVKTILRCAPIDSALEKELILQRNACEGIEWVGVVKERETSKKLLEFLRLDRGMDIPTSTECCIRCTCKNELGQNQSVGLCFNETVFGCRDV